MQIKSPDQKQSLSEPGRRVLVTGGLGFIGTPLCIALLDAVSDCELTIVDNLSSTHVDYSALHSHADIHIQDLRHFDQAESWDYIFHLASPVGSLGILHRHGKIASDILELAHCASEIASRSGAMLIYLSSSEVYGRDGRHDESAELVVPDRRGSRMEYALGKLTAEHALFNLSDRYQYPLKVIRPFNVVGPWQSDQLGFVLPTFFKAALKGVPLPVFGNGSQTRSFCMVDDMVSGIIAVALKGSTKMVYNVGNPNNRTTIRSLAEAVVDITGSASVIESIDPVRRYGQQYLEAFNKMPDIRKVQSHTGWQPKYSLQPILLKLLDFYRATSEIGPTVKAVTTAESPGVVDA